VVTRGGDFDHGKNPGKGRNAAHGRKSTLRVKENKTDIMGENQKTGGEGGGKLALQRKKALGEEKHGNQRMGTVGTGTNNQ